MCVYINIFFFFIFAFRERAFFSDTSSSLFVVKTRKRGAKYGKKKELERDLLRARKKHRERERGISLTLF